MKIRDKIFIYFSVTVIILTAVFLFVIYILFSEYREEEFQQQQKEKVLTTIKLIEKFKKDSEIISHLIDQQDINDFYDEKLLVFDSEKKIIFSSLDSLEILKTEKILKMLTPENRWVETKEGDYDLIGICVEVNGNLYYAVSKAYDFFGYSKLFFLRNVLVVIFFITSTVVLVLTMFLSRKISRPITDLAEKIYNFDITSNDSSLITIERSTHELNLLSQRFHDMINRINEVFAFQKHSIHHISHQLRTPISIMITELEKTKNNSDINIIKDEIESQIKKAKTLGCIISVLLEMSKIESGQRPSKELVRIDEMFYDVIAELNLLYSDFYFEVNYSFNRIDEGKLLIEANSVLLKQAIVNLLTNCVNYSSEHRAEILFEVSNKEELVVRITNKGKPILSGEKVFLFNHFFRGENSVGKIGFGIGLVLTKKILDYHYASIEYYNPIGDTNVFIVCFHLDMV